MPIRESERARYPADWKQISLRIRERAGQRCECTGQCGDDHVPQTIGALLGQPARCDAPNGVSILREVGGALWVTWEDCEAGALETNFAGRRFADKATKIVLTVAHLDHTPENCAEENLLAMCQRCHLCLDAELHQRHARETRRGYKAIGDLPGLDERDEE